MGTSCRTEGAINHRTLVFTGLISLAVLLLSESAIASTVCIDGFHTEISKINAELAKRLQRQAEIDQEVRQLNSRKGALDTEIGSVMAVDPSMSYTAGRLRMIALVNEIETLKRQRTALENEAYNNNEEIVALRSDIPSELQRKMRVCAIAEQPGSRVVNFSMQGFALAATGDLEMPLPRKSPYISLDELLPAARRGTPSR